MTIPVVVPDVMGDVRAWLRGLVDLTDTTGELVFFSIPLKAKFPMIRLTEAGLSAQPGETPVWTQRVMIEVIGAPLTGGIASDYFAVSKAKNIIVSAIWQLTGQIGSSTRVLDGDVDSVTDSPDPDDGGPRKVISAIFTVVAV